MLRDALAASGVDASRLAYINAHGPGTAQCDAAEARILDELFPEAARHLLRQAPHRALPGGGAPVEILATIYAYQTGFIPAPPQVAPGIPADQRAHAPAPGPMVKSSIGLGGYNP